MSDRIPVNDPPPPDDHHTWAKPAPPPCPDCDCCTANLCNTARQRGVLCASLSRPEPGHMDVTGCPCERDLTCWGGAA